MIQLYHGDCLQLIPKLNVHAQLIFADLPYASTKLGWDLEIDAVAFWSNIKLIREENTACLIMAGWYDPKIKIQMANAKEMKYTLIWDKVFGSNITQAKKQPLFTHEEIMVFSAGKITYNPIMVKRDTPIKSGKRGTPRNRTGTADVIVYDRDPEIYEYKYPVSILKIPRKLGKKKSHPTEKPIELLEYLIQTYTNEGDLVVDPVMGSGTTGIACKNLNRSFIGIEKELEYYEMACQRIKCDT